ncbi:MAG TPA: DUF167 family protein [Gammaproteobacteria bacterium]
MAAFYEWCDGNLLLRVKVQPRASNNAFCELLDERLKIRITAAPTDGQANQQLLQFLAKQFRVSKSQVSLLSGESSREKRFKIVAPRQIPAELATMIKPATNATDH